MTELKTILQCHNICFIVLVVQYSTCSTVQYILCSTVVQHHQSNTCYIVLEVQYSTCSTVQYLLHYGSALQYMQYSTTQLIQYCLNCALQYYITYISVHPPVHTWADKSNKLIASLVDNKAAHLALVALLAKSPEKIISME